VKDHLIAAGIVLAAAVGVTLFGILIYITHGLAFPVLIGLFVLVGIYFCVLDSVKDYRSDKARRDFRRERSRRNQGYF